MGLMLLGLSAGKCAVIIVRERIISEGNLKNLESHGMRQRRGMKRTPFYYPFKTQVCERMSEARFENLTGYETDAALLSL